MDLPAQCMGVTSAVVTLCRWVAATNIRVSGHSQTTVGEVSEFYSQRPEMSVFHISCSVCYTCLW